MPDIKDAKQQLHDALTEAGAMPQWELVATRQFLNQPTTMRLRVDGGHLYVHGNAMTFAPMSVKDEEVLISEQNADEWFARAVAAEAERDEARRQLAEMTADRDRAQHGYEQEHLLRHKVGADLDACNEQLELMTARYREANAESITLQRKLYDALGQLGQEQSGREQAEARCEELRRQVRGAARTISVGPDGMRMGPLEDTSCTGRAPAEVAPASFAMRSCRLAEGHPGPCEA